MNPLMNERGSILIITIIILYVLLGLGINFGLTNLSELQNARRFYHDTVAFWIAEAGLNTYVANPSILNEQNPYNMSLGGGKVSIRLDQSQPLYRKIISTAQFGQSTKSLSYIYPSAISEIYKNTLSTPKTLSVNGEKATAIINGQSRFGEKIKGSSTNADVFFENLSDNADPAITSVTPISKNNFINTFGDYVKHLNPKDVLIIKDSNDVTISAKDTAGKKVIYIENEQSTVDVHLLSPNLVAEHQQLTIITTGRVHFKQSSIQANDSSLNIIALDDYEENVQAPSTHQGIIFTQGKAIFDQITDSSTTSGNIIAQQGIEFGNITSTKIFQYANIIKGGFYPLGFEFISSLSLSGVAAYPTLWKEIRNP